MSFTIRIILLIVYSCAASTRLRDTPPEYCEFHRYNREGPFQVVDDSTANNYTFNISVHRLTYLCNNSGVLELLSHRFFSASQSRYVYDVLDQHHSNKDIENSNNATVIIKIKRKTKKTLELQQPIASFKFPYLERNCAKLYWTSWSETTDYCGSHLQQTHYYTRSCVDCYGNEVDQTLKPLCNGSWSKDKICRHQRRQQHEDNLDQKSKTSTTQSKATCNYLYISVGVAGGTVVIIFICVLLIYLVTKSRSAATKSQLPRSSSMTRPNIETVYYSTISGDIAQKRQTIASSLEHLKQSGHRRDTRRKNDSERDCICPKTVIGFPNDSTSFSSYQNETNLYYNTVATDGYELPMRFKQHDQKLLDIVYEN